MEHAFTVMLRAELTSASQNKLNALTQSALKLRPSIVARVLSNHVRQCSVEALSPALQLAEGLCRSAGPEFKHIFEAELPELFEQSWRRADRHHRSQLLKLYVSWKTTLGQSIIGAIDVKMKAAMSNKREPETPPIPTPPKRLKHEPVLSPYEDMTPAPVPMQTNNSPYWSMNKDPNVIHISSGEEDSDSGEPTATSMPIMGLIDMLMEAAKKCQSTVEDQPKDVPTIRPVTHLDFGTLHVYEEGVYKRLVQGTKATKPKYLDWRFHQRFERRKQNCQSRVWYAPPETWAQDSDPKDLSPQQLLQKLSKPRSWKTEDVMRVPVDDSRPQTHCAISGDLLEMQFDEVSGRWQYKNCRRLHGDEASANSVLDGAVCQADCIKPSYRA